MKKDYKANYRLLEDQECCYTCVNTIFDDIWLTCTQVQEFDDEKGWIPLFFDDTEDAQAHICDLYQAEAEEEPRCGECQIPLESCGCGARPPRKTPPAYVGPDVIALKAENERLRSALELASSLMDTCVEQGIGEWLGKGQVAWALTKRAIRDALEPERKDDK
jgi:hypothetical protein